MPVIRDDMVPIDARSSHMDHAGELLILTGPPGSGKTTTAKALAVVAGSPKVHLHSDDFWHFIKYGAVQPYLPQAHDQNKVVVDVLAKAAQGYARGGYFVILDGIVGPWFLAAFRALSVPVHYVVLHPRLEVAIQRCQERGGDTLTDPGPIAELHRQFSSLGQLEGHSLPIDALTRTDVLGSVIKAVQSGAYRLSN